MPLPDLPPNVFRANVGAVIFNQQGQVLALERAKIPGAWQLPQGGLEPGETPLEAVYREIAEETGIQPEELELLAQAPEWIAYELPEEYKSPKMGLGQCQMYFAFRWKSPRPLQLDQTPEVEFQASKWTSLEALAEETIAFRRPVYLKLGGYFQACRIHG